MTFRSDNRNSTKHEIKNSMLARYASQEQRVGLMQELDHYHDCMKTILNLHLDPANDPRFKHLFQFWIKIF